MYQIVFSQAAAAEISQLPKDQQLNIVSELNFLPEDFESKEQFKAEEFGRLQRNGRTLYRFRSNDYRIYFEVADKGLLIQRIMHRDTLQDFLYRTNMPLAEDEALEKLPEFWDQIDASKA